MKTVWIYTDTSKMVGDPDHLKVFETIEAAEAWFEENDPEGVAFEYPILSIVDAMKLKSIMRKLHLTSEHLAELCGVNRSQVWRWSVGRIAPPQYVWTILAMIEGAQYQEILTTTERKRRVQQEPKAVKSRAIVKSRTETLF